ncbi:MAG TPA: hypothetical protein VN822_00045 [Candidatus Acidoferrales bacterium]|nr:hypothetical protein [Candidatus Acidoferrales bacterium]
MAKAKRAGFPPILCLAMLVFAQNNGCTSCAGIPSDFNSVVLTPSALQVGPNGVVTIGAAVPKDTTGAGVSWAIALGQGNPPSIGTFGPNTKFQATYTAPPSVTVKFTVVITATTLAVGINPAETNSVTITVNPPQPLKITTTTLPNGVVGTAYPTGTQLQASGGVKPYIWSLANATTLPPGLALAADGTISSTPVPTTRGTYNFTVQVTDSDVPPAPPQMANLSIKVTDALNGNYAFEFSGFNSNGNVVIAGSFAADGLGNITGGVEDFNTLQPLAQNQMLRTFTGTYTLGLDFRGQVIFSSLTGTPTYDIAIDSKGLHGRLVEFDATGIRGSGELVQQNTSTCTSSTLPGTSGTDFVIGVSGVAGNFVGISPGPAALVGRFTAEPTTSGVPGTIDNGEVDFNAPNLIDSASLLSGTFNTTTQSARCTMSITPTGFATETYSVYPIATTAGKLTEAFVVETDTVSQATPYVTVGKMIQQVGYPFTQASNSLTGPSVAGLSGNAIPNGQAAYLPFVSVAQLSASGSAFSIPLVYNFGGTVSGTLSGTLTPGDSFGRVVTNLSGTAPVPVFYVIDANESFCILANQNTAVLGLFEPQSKAQGANTFSAGTVGTGTGQLATGTSAPSTTATTNFSGATTLDGVSVVGGKQDTSTTLANTPNQTVTGTYALSGTGPTDGSGTFTLTAPAAFTGDFYIVSPTKIVMISTTVGDLNPVLIFLGQQTDDFGVN